MKTTTNNTNTTSPATTHFAASVLRQEAINAFQEHLAREFHMPASMALARVNSELAANPLTCGIQLQVRPSDFDARHHEVRPNRFFSPSI